MGENLRLKAADGFIFGGYEALPKRPPRGGVVVIQEIFGVNDHIISVCDRLAQEGYHAAAPALFDRYELDFRLGYTADEVDRAKAMMPKLDWSGMLMDADAAYRHLRKDSPEVAAVGFCLGGSLTYFMALEPDYLAAASCFYGGRIVESADKAPRCPTQMHFGDRDPTIPRSDVEKIQNRRGEDCEIFVYGAGHGFHNDARTNYVAAEAARAWSRTLELLARSIQG